MALSDVQRTRIYVAPPVSNWWSTRTYTVALILFSALPLIWPSIPPITDLAGHMGRYRIELDLTHSPFLHQWYDFHWAWVGNLGVDLLILPLTKLFGLELAVKLIVLAIPPLTVAGMLMIAREVHGHLPATAAFALPLAYSAPFQFGFVNFALAMGVALLMFGLWLRLGRLGLRKLRAWLLLVLSPILWTIHAFGWGALGLMVFASVCSEAFRSRIPWPQACIRIFASCLPLAPPVLLFVDWQNRQVEGGVTRHFFVVQAKLGQLLSILRNSDFAFDAGSALVLLGLILWAGASRRYRIDQRLGAAALALFIAFLCLPEILLGSAFAAMRIAPFCVALAVLALGPRATGWQAHAIAGLACLFFVSRIASHTLHYATLDRVWSEQLSALDHVPRGARIFAMSNVPCLGSWDARRMEHLGALGIVRRDAFVNGQWTLAGAQLLSIHFAAAKGFSADPTQLLMPRQCRQAASYSLDEAVRNLPRDTFDFVWLIDLPRDQWPTDRGFAQVWHAERGVLYKISRTPRPMVTSMP